MWLLWANTGHLHCNRRYRLYPKSDISQLLSIALARKKNANSKETGIVSPERGPAIATNHATFPPLSRLVTVARSWSEVRLAGLRFACSRSFSATYGPLGGLLAGCGENRTTGLLTAIGSHVAMPEIVPD